MVQVCRVGRHDDPVRHHARRYLEYFCDPDSALVLARLVREVAALALARKIRLSDRSPLPVESIVRGSEAQAVVLIQALGEELRSAAPEHRMSSLQDLEAGRRLEIEETLGYALQSAGQLNLSLPLLESFSALVTGIDRLRRQPHASAIA